MKRCTVRINLAVVNDVAGCPRNNVGLFPERVVNDLVQSFLKRAPKVVGHIVITGVIRRASVITTKYVNILKRELWRARGVGGSQDRTQLSPVVSLPDQTSPLRFQVLFVVGRQLSGHQSLFPL